MIAVRRHTLGECGGKIASGSYIFIKPTVVFFNVLRAIIMLHL
jgi:hypothetical protein